ncbi:MAG: THUMP domain-containing protein [Candidatus Nanohaloarchaea archaeon]
MDLAEAELNGFLEAVGANEMASRDGRLAFTESHPEQLKRLALTHEVLEKIDPEEFRPEGSYAVRVENLSQKNIEKEEIESEIGQKISTKENSVDLENPETVIKVYITEGKRFYAKLVEDIPRNLFEERSNEKRPYSSPISMDPVLARVLVNLSEASLGGSILDPFCGTGGILIEAGLCGIMPKGLDIQEEMVEGCKENLNNYGIINFDVQKCDISEANEVFDEYNAVISDLPYGKASKQENEAIERFLDLIENFEGKTVFMYNKASVGEYKADFEVYVHKSLTRHIYIISKPS